MSALQGESAPTENSSTQESYRFDFCPWAFRKLRNFAVPLPGFAIVMNIFGLFPEQRHLHAAARWAAQGFYGDADRK